MLEYSYVWRGSQLRGLMQVEAAQPEQNQQGHKHQRLLGKSFH